MGHAWLVAAASDKRTDAVRYVAFALYSRISIPSFPELSGEGPNHKLLHRMLLPLPGSLRTELVMLHLWDA